MPRVKKTGTRKAAPRTKAAARKTVRKTATRKTAARKTAPRAAAKKAPRAAAKAAPASSQAAIRAPLTKAQLMTVLSESTGVVKKDVVAVMDELGSIIERHVKKRSAGQFTLPGLLKIKTVRKKATKARKGRNPFTGEEIMISAKPARTAVRVTPLRGLKGMVDS